MESHTRQSPALEQFFSQIQGRSNLRILDLCPISQANVTQIGGLGHRLFCEDFLTSLDDFFGDGDFYAAQENANRANAFLDMTFRQLEPPFHGALVWDALQFLAPPLLDLTIQELHKLLEPDSLIVALFPANEKERMAPTAYFRIQDTRTLEVHDRGVRPTAPFLSNRSIEKLFGDFQSVKFFLARDRYREVVIRR